MLWNGKWIIYQKHVYLSILLLTNVTTYLVYYKNNCGLTTGSFPWYMTNDVPDSYRKLMNTVDIVVLNKEVYGHVRLIELPLPTLFGHLHPHFQPLAQLPILVYASPLTHTHTRNFLKCCGCRNTY